ncbi:MAG: phosphotransferase [Acidiferrobacterales bacterium]
MAITEFSGTHPRSEIGFVEDDPPEEAGDELEKRSGYKLYRFDESSLAESGRKLATTGAVVFRQAPDKPRRVLEQLRRYAATLLWHDCRIFVESVPATPGANGPYFRGIVVDELSALNLPPSGLNDEEAKKFNERFGGPNAQRLTPCVHILERPGSWSDVAVLLRNNPAGVAPQRDLTIDAFDLDGQRLVLTPEQDVLVRRAFWNCASVRLVRIGNGLSGVLTFRAFAHLLQGVVGSKWPYMYFVKIGERAKISKEFLAYQANALENIPYHLGPRLRLDRCALGHDQGIIVSDYVNGAEPLKDCARDGRAVPVIANLFNSTLWSWRNGAEPEQTQMQEYLRDKILLTIPSHREPLVKAYGASKSPEELMALFMALSSQPVLVGVVHGDLHATNVLVRGNDAIVIDFEKVGTRAPLLWDMASLEGGLFVDGFIGDRRTGVDLLKSVECLYKADTFDGNMITCHPGDGSAWFFDCVRQIRMQAGQVELVPRQYALALAAALARKACNEEDFREDKIRDPTPSCPLSREDVRALAYVLSERILVGLSQ